MKFTVLRKDSKSNARAGVIKTPHGDIKTPAFVAVGTRASVRSLTPEDLREIGVELLFGNTYHLHLRPGEDAVEEFGGLGKFMGWKGPTITDSGGFQVFSLGKAKIFASEEQTEVNLVKISNDKVVFRSHIDGSLHEFTPEISIKIQKKLGADIILCFDECAPHPSTYEYTKEAMERTHEWARRSLAEFKVIGSRHSGNSERSVEASRIRSWTSQDDDGNDGQALYGIVQGGVYKDLREESARFISSLPFDGIAIGGVSVGESKSQMRDVLSWVQPFLPDEKPRHLLGIGEIDDIFAAVENGYDTFDCVIPTRFGRYGIIFAPPNESEAKGRFRIDINKTIYAKDKAPLSKDCKCYVCQKFTRGYIHHLFKAQELLAYRLASYHNMYFVVSLVKQIRQSIMDGKFEKMKKEWIGDKA